MFKKTSIKKTTNQFLDEDDDIPKIDKIADTSKNICKIKPKGVSINNLKNMREIKHTTNKASTTYEEQVGLINIQYTKSIQQERSESLLDKYIQERIQKHFTTEGSFDPDGPQGQVDENQVILEEILDIQKKYLNREDQDQAVWVGGIMEVNLSLEEKAQKIAQMEEIKRGEYFKSLITGVVYKKKIQIPLRKNQYDNMEEVTGDKHLKELSDKFYHRGRVYKHQQHIKNQGNNQLDTQSERQQLQYQQQQKLQQQQLQQQQIEEKKINI